VGVLERRQERGGGMEGKSRRSRGGGDRRCRMSADKGRSFRCSVGGMMRRGGGESDGGVRGGGWFEHCAFLLYVLDADTSVRTLQNILNASWNIQ